MSSFLSNRGFEEIFELDGLNTMPLPQNKFELDNEDIITSKTLPSQAFAAFNGKFYDSHNRAADEYVFEKNTELPWQTLFRIKSELIQLKHSLNSDSLDNSSIFSILYQELDRLLADSDSIDERKLKAIFSDKLERISVDEIRKLLDHSGSSAICINQLQSSSLESRDNYSSFERRLSFVESVIGTKHNGLDVDELSSYANKTTSVKSSCLSIYDHLYKLEQKVRLLDSASIDSLKAKLASIRIEMESLSKNKNADSRVLDACKRVDDIMLWISKVELFAEELPAIIIRLKSLENIHVTSNRLDSILSSLNHRLTTMESDLNSNRLLLQSIDSRLKDNMQTMLSNVERIDSKIAIIKR